jgi:hypothetical protein
VPLLGNETRVSKYPDGFVIVTVPMLVNDPPPLGANWIVTVWAAPPVSSAANGAGRASPQTSRLPPRDWLVCGSQIGSLNAPRPGFGWPFQSSRPLA